MRVCMYICIFQSPDQILLLILGVFLVTSFLGTQLYHLRSEIILLFHTIVSPPYPQVPHLWIQPTLDQKYSGKDIPESSKKQNLNMPHTGSYLDSICIVFTTIYIAFRTY